MEEVENVGKLLEHTYNNIKDNSLNLDARITMINRRL
jgi:hypothetical protein